MILKLFSHHGTTITVGPAALAEAKRVSSTIDALLSISFEAFLDLLEAMQLEKSNTSAGSIGSTCGLGTNPAPLGAGNGQRAEGVFLGKPERFPKPTSK
jgi:hypothetical protein